MTVVNSNVALRVREHANFVDASVKGHVRFFTALQGSQNYGLDDQFSDVDTKSLLVPTFGSLVHGSKRLGTTLLVAPTEEHADVKDAREMFNTFLKQNVNFLEILFTPYVSVAPGFQPFYDELYAMRETVAHYNPYQALRTMCGMAFEKYHAFDHPYPAAMEKLNKFGYDPKQLSHMLRMKEFVVRYSSGEPYQDCLFTKDREYLLNVKRGLYSLDEAQTVREDTNVWFQNFLNGTVRVMEERKNSQVEEFLRDLTFRLFTYCYTQYNMYHSEV